jgi:predicted amidophosphoribosyltransferase
MRMIDFVIALGDLIMPRACLACGRRLGMRERHLCLSCAADVPYTRFWLAAHNPLADRFNAVLERHRGTEPMDYAYAAALLYYKGAYRSIPRALKYQGDLAAGRHYGALLGCRLAAAPHFADIDLVIPVPLHWTRLRSRGYNQAEILARALVDAFRSAPAAVSSGTPSAVIPGLTRNLPEVRTDLLVRARRTRTQTRVSVDQKAQNVASAFQVPVRFSLWARAIRRLSRIISFLSARWPIKVGHDEDESSEQDDTRHSRPDRESPAEVLASARHILLVDDTFTTGATLYACYAALRPFTTARISIATLAAVEGSPSGTGGP